jgi:hypothetical protein
MSYTVVSKPSIDENNRVYQGFYSPSSIFSTLADATKFAMNSRNESAIVKTGNNKVIYWFPEYESDDDID